MPWLYNYVGQPWKTQQTVDEVRRELAIDGQPTDQTFLPESIIRTGGDVAFSLSAIPNMVSGAAETSAPPSFGVGSTVSLPNASIAAPS